MPGTGSEWYTRFYLFELPNQAALLGVLLKKSKEHEASPNSWPRSTARRCTVYKMYFYQSDTCHLTLVRWHRLYAWSTLYSGTTVLPSLKARGWILFQILQGVLLKQRSISDWIMAIPTARLTNGVARFAATPTWLCECQRRQAR